MSQTESEVEEPGAKAMQMQLHPTPPIDPPNACVTFLRGAMGSRFHAARPGGPSRLRGFPEVVRAREELPAERWPPRRASGLCVSARPLGTLAAANPAAASAHSCQRKAFWVVRAAVTQPSHTASTLARGAEGCAVAGWAWGPDDLKGFSRVKMSFLFPS